MANPGLTTCLSPAQLAEESLLAKRIVIIDVLRATSTICAALYHGMKSVITVADIKAAATYRKGDFIVAAERQGKTPEGFQYGNSPLTYQTKEFINKTLVLSTSNGTNAVEKSKTASEILCGAFVNLNALIAYMQKHPMDSILLCAGWHEQPAFEDSLLAGALVKMLKADYSIENDAGLLAGSLYEKHAMNLFEAFKQSDHFKRLSGLGREEDLRYCAGINVAPVVPQWQKDRFVVVH